MRVKRDKGLSLVLRESSLSTAVAVGDANAKLHTLSRLTFELVRATATRSTLQSPPRGRYASGLKRKGPSRATRETTLSLARVSVMLFAPRSSGSKNLPSPSCSRVVSRCSTRPRTSSPAGTRLCRPDAFPILVPRIGSLRIRSSASVPRRVPLDTRPLTASLGSLQNPRCPIAPKFEMFHLSKVRANSIPSR